MKGIFFATMLAFVAFTAPSFAQNYPQRPVVIVDPIRPSQAHPQSVILVDPIRPSQGNR